MLDLLRIIVAGALLYGSTAIHAPVHADALTRVLPRAEQPVKADPCKATWPYVIRACVA